MVDGGGMTTLATYLASARITQEEFAKKVGLKQAAISRLARGLSRPSLEAAVAIERITEGAVPAASWVPIVFSEAAE